MPPSTVSSLGLPDASGIGGVGNGVGGGAGAAKGTAGPVVAVVGALKTAGGSGLAGKRVGGVRDTGLGDSGGLGGSGGLASGGIGRGSSEWLMTVTGTTTSTVR